MIEMARVQNVAADGVTGAIGNTPLIKLRRASAETGCEILAKAEFMNPGGSVKDRAGLAIIAAAEADGRLKPGGVIVEGTAGNTGIGITLVAHARGYKSVIVMPETQSQEKIDFLRMIGADLRLVPAKPYKDPGNYVHVSERLAKEMGAVWANQFDNLANREGHRRQGGRVHLRLRHRRHAGRRRHGAEGKVPGRPNHPGGPGGQRALRLGQKQRPHGKRVFHYRGHRPVPRARQSAGCADRRCVAHPGCRGAGAGVRAADRGGYFGRRFGINVAAAIRVAKQMGPGHSIVTILCDGGARYQSKLFNPEFLRSKNLPVPRWLT
jgi:cysteine synthase A